MSERVCVCREVGWGGGVDESQRVRKKRRRLSFYPAGVREPGGERGDSLRRTRPSDDNNNNDHDIRGPLK